MSHRAQPQPQVLGLLDIGTSKMACLMFARTDGGMYVPLGFGHQRSRGLKASLIIDADAAEESLRATVVQAEYMAGLPLKNVLVAASCGRLSSNHFEVGADLAGRTVTTADLDRLMSASHAHAASEDRAVLHINMLSSRIDGRAIGGDPLGSSGRRLAMEMHAVTADSGALSRVRHVAERCQLHILGVAAAPFASALAVTTAEDRAGCVIVLDCGAGTTSLAVFVNGLLAATHVVPIGGNHLTYDLMRALDTSITEAERIKKKYGMQYLAHPAQDDAIAYQACEENHAQTKQVTRAEITKLITSRIDALLRQLQCRLAQCGLSEQINGDMILTGGASLLAGFPDRCATIFNRRTRRAQPLPQAGLPTALQQPAFATIAGLNALWRVPADRLGLDLRGERFTADETVGAVRGYGS